MKGRSVGGATISGHTGWLASEKMIRIRTSRGGTGFRHTRAHCPASVAGKWDSSSRSTPCRIAVACTFGPGPILVACASTAGGAWHRRWEREDRPECNASPSESGVASLMRLRPVRLYDRTITRCVAGRSSRLVRDLVTATRWSIARASVSWAKRLADKVMVDPFGD
jgi:hypothetical protein